MFLYILPVNQYICTIYIFSILIVLVDHAGTHCVYHYNFEIINIDKMISIDHVSINRQPSDLNNQGNFDRWKPYKYCFIPISGIRSQCLQYCLNAIYHEIDKIKKSTILWSVLYWVNIQYVVRMTMRVCSTGCKIIKLYHIMMLIKMAI